MMTASRRRIWICCRRFCFAVHVLRGDIVSQGKIPESSICHTREEGFSDTHHNGFLLHDWRDNSYNFIVIAPTNHNCMKSGRICILKNQIYSCMLIAGKQTSIPSRTKRQTIRFCTILNCSILGGNDHAEACRCRNRHHLQKHIVFFRLLRLANCMQNRKRNNFCFGFLLPPCTCLSVRKNCIVPQR